MKTGDRFLQRWRMRVARPWIPRGARLLDIGCYQGDLFLMLDKDLGAGVGIDPEAPPLARDRWWLLPIPFREPLPFAAASFDAVVLLATLEHMPHKLGVARECLRILRPGGRVIVTVPGLWVDLLLAILVRLRLVDGMDLGSHHGFDPRQARPLFEGQGFILDHARRFQLGLNHLFVWHRPES